MDPKEYITIAEFCASYEIDQSFVLELNNYGLVQIVTIEETPALPVEQVRDIERIVRLHYDLEINLEGIDAISHLLRRVSSLQDEVRILQNKLRRYEE
jgi:hypothetical protein